MEPRKTYIHDSVSAFHFRAIDYVFLDRDGVVNRKRPEGKYVTQIDELELIPGAADAIARLNTSGRKVILVTNQRGIALGLMSERGLLDIHIHLRAELARFGATLDAIYYCPHDNNECDCRKPGTGMIKFAFRDFPNARPEISIFIGDSLSDIECGRRAGMATLFIQGEATRRKFGFEEAMSTADASAPSLADAVRMIL